MRGIRFPDLCRCSFHRPPLLVRLSNDHVRIRETGTESCGFRRMIEKRKKGEKTLETK